MSRFLGLSDKLARIERRIHYAKAVAQLLEMDAWKAIANLLEAEERHVAQRLLLSDKLTEHETGILKGEYRTLRLLRSLPHISVRQLAEHERVAKGLRAKVQDMQNRGLDKIPPDVRAEVARLRRRLETEHVRQA